jgi:hypothetical protein
MISITRYISEGVLGKINKVIDNNILSKSRPGRAFMRLENRFDKGLKNETKQLGEDLSSFKNKVLNFKDNIQRKNFKIRK